MDSNNNNNTVAPSLTNPNEAIHLIIKDKNGIVLEEDVFAISSYNEVGLFDVLPLHTNFISLIKKKLTIHKKDGDKDMDIGTGLLKVVENQVHVYLGLPEPEEEVKNPAEKAKSVVK